MNKIIILCAFFACTMSSAILACPNLSANYARCVSSSGDNSNSENIVVSQKRENDMVIYSIKSKDIQSGEEETKVMIADGKTRKIEEKDPETGLAYTQYETYTCMDQSIVGKVNLIIDNELLLDVTITTKKIGKRMISEIKGKSMNTIIDDTIICE